MQLVRPVRRERRARAERRVSLVLLVSRARPAQQDQAVLPEQLVSQAPRARLARPALRVPAARLAPAVLRDPQVLPALLVQQD